MYASSPHTHSSPEAPPDSPLVFTGFGAVVSPLAETEAAFLPSITETENVACKHRHLWATEVENVMDSICHQRDELAGFEVRVRLSLHRADNNFDPQSTPCFNSDFEIDKTKDPLFKETWLVCGSTQHCREKHAFNVDDDNAYCGGSEVGMPMLAALWMC